MADSIGKQIAEARYRKGWSRREVIEATDNRLSEIALRNIEKGYSNPLPQTIYILAAALDLNPKDLIEEASA